MRRYLGAENVAYGQIPQDEKLSKLYDDSHGDDEHVNEVEFPMVWEPKMADEGQSYLVVAILLPIQGDA